MHRDSLPARRRFTGLAGSGDSLALARLASREKPVAVVSASAQDAQRLVDDIAAAEDVVSEAFMEVWRQAGRFEGRSSVSTWIMAIARFKALSARRRHPEAELDAQVTGTVADPAPTPEQVVLEGDRCTQLRACLSQLSPDHRAIIDLIYYHDKTIEEVAEIVGAPKNTVKTRMFYARKRLAWLLARHDDFNHLAVAPLGDAVLRGAA